MGKNLFVIIQIPFCDLRRFFLDPPDLTTKPSWPSPGALDFVRRFGKVRSRLVSSEELSANSVASPHLITERHFVDATKHVDCRTYPLNSRLFNSKFKARARVKFFRLIGDGDASIRFELGVEILAAKEFWHSARNLHEAIDALMSNHSFHTRFTTANEGKIAKESSMTGLASMLRRNYFVASELHDGSGKPTPFESRLIRPLNWSAFVLMPGKHEYRWVRNSRSKLKGFERFDACMFSTPNAAGVPISSTFPVVANYTRKSSPQVRRFRMSYFRIYSEISTLNYLSAEFCGGALHKELNRDQRRADQRIRALRFYYRSKLDRIKDTIWSFERDAEMDSLRDSVEMAGAFSAEKLERLEFAGGVLAGERSTNKALNMFFIDKYQSNHGVNMSNYTFNAEAHGQFGDGGTANFAENLYQGGATSDEMNALVRELDQLYVALNENTDGSAQAKKEASAIENAKEAADRGDQKGVIHYLKSTGQWTLDIAAKIGVPVAVAAIKKAIGA